MILQIDTEELLIWCC